MKISSEELDYVKSLGSEDCPLPISLHAIRRLKTRRKQTSFEESVSDVVEAWTMGADLYQDEFHRELLKSLVKSYDFENFRYVLYKGFLYIFNHDRVLVTLFQPEERIGEGFEAD